MPNAAGWRERATPLSQPTSLDITVDKLIFAAFFSAPALPNSLTLALFSPNVAVDANGTVLHLAKDDFDGLTALAHAVNTLPDSGGFRNQWRVKHPITCRPFDRVLVQSEFGVRETSVYGWDTKLKALEEAVGTITTLPDPLYDLIGLAREAREGHEGARRSEDVVRQVKAFLCDDI